MKLFQFFSGALGNPSDKRLQDVLDKLATEANSWIAKERVDVIHSELQFLSWKAANNDEWKAVILKITYIRIVGNS